LKERAGAVRNDKSGNGGLVLYRSLAGPVLLSLLPGLNNQKNHMQKTVFFLTGFLLLASAAVPARGAFALLQVFGDGISSTTNNPAVGPYFYGQRFSNGRVWVEVLAQRQGLAFYHSNNWSYFGNTSTSLVAAVSGYTAPAGAEMSDILFVIWVNCADLFYPALNHGTNLNAWTNAMNLSLANHYRAITNLYAKGARTLVMPNAVDLSTIPQFNTSAYTNFVHQRCVEYNAAFVGVLNQARAECAGLEIYLPDFFTLLTDLIAHPADYSVTNALYNGHSIDVIYSPLLADKNTNGPGTNYIFWDRHDPSAKVHLWMANLTQQLLSPARIAGIVMLGGSNRLDLVNVPVGWNGLVLGCTNVASTNWLVPGNWTTNGSFSSVSATQSVFVVDVDTSLVPACLTDDGPWPPGPIYHPNYTWQLYRLYFPYAWVWP
jgi:phospholipase/lecithinase/hemolysin